MGSVDCNLNSTEGTSLPFAVTMLVLPSVIANTQQVKMVKKKGLV